MKKIGLYFGSFNPIHIGHLAVAQYMLQEIPFDEVWLIISPHNPFKVQSELINEKDRLKMAQLAIGDHMNIEASDFEFYLPKPSYTINTLKKLDKAFKNNEFSLIMGEDNLVKFNCWKAYEEILDNYKIFVYPRESNEDYDIPKNILVHENIHRTSAPKIDISSTRIRAGIGEGKDMRIYLPGPVFTYIQKHKLYHPN